jgi:hypothetical protein
MEERMSRMGRSARQPARWVESLSSRRIRLAAGLSGVHVVDEASSCYPPPDPLLAFLDEL